MNILEALAALDVEDNEHWTNDGQPAVAAMQEATGDAELTRAQITEAAPLFSRENPVLEVPDPEPDTIADPNTDPDEVLGDFSEADIGDDEVVDKPSGPTEAEEIADFTERADANATGRDHPDVLAAQAGVDELTQWKVSFDKEFAKRSKHQIGRAHV